MNLLIDANLPPVVADCLDPLARNDSHRVYSKVGYFNRTNIPDEEWITEFSKLRNSAFLTCDTHIRLRPLEVEAFLKSGMTGFWLRTKSWHQYLRNDELHELVWRLAKRWPQFVSLATNSRRQAFEVPLKGVQLNGLNLRSEVNRK